VKYSVSNPVRMMVCFIPAKRLAPKG